MNSLSLLRIIPSRLCTINQTRNAWQLKRRITPPLQAEWQSPYIVGDYIKDVNSQIQMQEVQELYEVVEQTDHNKKPPITVILLGFVEGVGVAGDIITMKAGKARWELIMPGKAVYASPFNLDYYKDLISQKETVAGPSSAISTITMKNLEGSVYAISMSPKNPWTIEPWHIRAAFRKAGVIVPEEAIELPRAKITGPDANKLNKAFLVYLTINNRERVPTRFVINHVDAPSVPYWYTGEKEAIFEEEADLIKSMKVHEKPREIIVEEFED